jgi:hypothetical protein
MDNPVFKYFSDNLATVTKEELLEALNSALESADHWRNACFLWTAMEQDSQSRRR